MNYEAGDIFITNGGSEALTFAVMALCDPDDEIMVFEPFYANYTTFATEFGAKINAVTTSVENGYHLPDAAEIEKHITPKTKAILLTNPATRQALFTPKQKCRLLPHLPLSTTLP